MGLLDNTVMGDVWEKWKRGELNYYDKFNTWKDEKTLSNRKDFEKKYNIAQGSDDSLFTAGGVPLEGKYKTIQSNIDDTVKPVSAGPGKQIKIDTGTSRHPRQPGSVIGAHQGQGYSEEVEQQYQKGDLIPKQKDGLTENDGKSITKAAGMDWQAVKKRWKDKGGMDALMSNPAFTLGLALMQSSAKGKRIDENILDNFVKATNISAEYKDRVKAKGGILEATADQVASVKATLNTMGTSAPNWFEALVKPGNQGAQYEAAVEKIAIHMQEKLKKMREDSPNKTIKFDDDFRRKVIQELIRKKKIRSKGGFLWFDKTLETTDASLTELPTRAEGGPVQAGEPYVVGEKGPEVIIPHSDGNVISNDDSQIYAMLLASNPQLQQVSRPRAERILRSRFPEYFE